MSFTDRKRLLAALAASMLPLVPAMAVAQSGDAVPDGANAVTTETRVVDGKTYTATKYIDASGTVRGQVVDASGAVVADTASGGAPVIAPALRDQLATAATDSKIKVIVALRVAEPDPVPTSSGSATIRPSTDGGQAPTIELRQEGVETTSEALAAADAEELKRIARRRSALEQQARDGLRQLARRHGLGGDAAVAAAVRRGDSSVVIALRPAQIQALAAESGDLVAGIEIYDPPKDQIASAMVSSRVNPYAINYAGRRGENIGIYMTESGCAPTGFITRYQRLAGSDTSHSRNVMSIMRAVSPQSYIYCRGGAVLPTSADLAGYGGNPRVHLVNRSNGGGDNADYTITDRDWDNFAYVNPVATFVSAGNNGTAGGYLIYPSKALNINSVASYNDANNAVSSFSSYRDSQTKSAKPEFSMPGENITAGGFTMSGTSMSSPHGAAFAADLLSAYSFMRLRPALIKASMIAGATKPITGGFDKVGLGACDFYSAYYNGHFYWWSGANSSYSYFDSTDPLPNNGYIDVYQSLSASLSTVRASLVWLNRGTWTYNNRTSLHPIGMDIDIAVYSPTGALVASSSSFDNPYESVTFDPTVTGTYRFRIYRYANRDTASNLLMGLAVNW